MTVRCIHHHHHHHPLISWRHKSQTKLQGRIILCQQSNKLNVLISRLVYKISLAVMSVLHFLRLPLQLFLISECFRCSKRSVFKCLTLAIYCISTCLVLYLEQQRRFECKYSFYKFVETMLHRK